MGGLGGLTSFRQMTGAEAFNPVDECNGDFTPFDNEDRQWTPHTLGCNIAKSHAAPGFPSVC